MLTEHLQGALRASMASYLGVRTARKHIGLVCA